MLATMGAVLTEQSTEARTPPRGLAVTSWTYFGGDYAIAVVGDRFVFAESAKIDSLDKLRRARPRAQLVSPTLKQQTEICLTEVMAARNAPDKSAV